MMTKTIGVAGKGGTGKTTFTSLMIRNLIEASKGAILAVDADPNSNLNEALGIEVVETIADILDEVKSGGTIPAGMPKDVFVEYRLNQVMQETDSVDLVVMGVPQGSGCYCYPNDLMRKYLNGLNDNYDYVIMDNEAGLEHLSRKIVSEIDILFVISDSSARGVRSAGRVREIVETLKLDVKDIYLVITKSPLAGLGALEEEIQKTGLTLIGQVPYDPEVAQKDLEGLPLIELPQSSLSVQAVQEIMKKVGL